jgi:hypothetical protein
MLVAVAREARGSNGCSLEAVIETRDHFDRVVFSATELDEGVERLSAAGLLNVRGRELSLTAQGRETARGPVEGDVFAEVERVQHELSERPAADREAGQRLKEGLSARALASYLGTS